MSYGIDRAGFNAQPRPVSDTGGAQQVTGEYRGQTVVKGEASITSLIHDSQEELPAHLSEHRSTGLAKRTARQGSSSRLREILQKYNVGGPNASGASEKFQQTAEWLKKLGKATPDQIKRQLSENFQHHESSVLMALEELLAAEGGHDELLSALRETKADLGRELAQVHEQLKTYEGITDVLSNLIGEHKEEDRAYAIEAMISRLGSDLHAQGPATEPAQVKATVDSLYFLEVVRNMQQSFSDLLGKIKKEYKAGDPSGSHRLMQDLLPLKDQRWVDGSKITPLADRQNLRAIEPKIYFFRELHGIVRRLPDKVYNAADDRLRLATAVQEALDAAIEQEEEQL